MLHDRVGQDVKAAVQLNLRSLTVRFRSPGHRREPCCRATASSSRRIGRLSAATQTNQVGLDEGQKVAAKDQRRDRDTEHAVVAEERDVETGTKRSNVFGRE